MAMKIFALLFVTLVVLSAMANAQDELISTLAPAPAPAMENGSGMVVPGFCALLLASLISLMGLAV